MGAKGLIDRLTQLFYIDALRYVEEHRILIIR